MYKLEKFLTKELSTFGINPAQNKRELMIECFSLGWEKGMSLNTILFLSFHIAQHMPKGAAQHNFLAFFFTGSCLQLDNKSLTRCGQVQLMPKTMRRLAHYFHIKGQWIKIYSRPSSAFLQKGHLLAKCRNF